MPQKNAYSNDIGYVTSRENSLTSESNILYDGKQTDLLPDSKWILLCTKHNTLKNLKNKKTATEMLKNPQNWCDSCKALHKIEEAELILTLRPDRTNIEQLQRLALFAIGDPEKVLLFKQLTGNFPEFYIEEKQ